MKDTIQNIAKYLKYNGDVIAFWGVIGLMVGGAAWGVVYVAQETDRQDRWESECRVSNGLVVVTSKNRRECYVDGKRVILEGFRND